MTNLTINLRKDVKDTCNFLFIYIYMYGWYIDIIVNTYINIFILFFNLKYYYITIKSSGVCLFLFLALKKIFLYIALIYIYIAVLVRA